MTFELDQQGAFKIDNYQQAKAFANFFPGVAGLYGIPMWAFYVNRGQAISSFGIESKDKAILEFQPANKAYRYTSVQGFRTFLNITQGGAVKFYEPFANPLASPYKVKQEMVITSHDLTISETNSTLGLKTTVNYFTMPEEPFAALVRRVRIENISKKDITVSCVDGLPMINPYGLKDWLSKNMSRTVEAWMSVLNVSKKAPFYQLKVEVADTPQVTHIDEGNFYFAYDASSGKLLDPVIEAAAVFGNALDFVVPERFAGNKQFRVPAVQQSSNRTPSAMAFASFALKAGKSKELTALTGFVHDLAELNSVVRKSVNKGYIEEKSARNRAIIDGIKDNCFTKSASRAFDQYCGQTFLDNVLRGGLPVSLQTAEGPVAFNVYSRKHGDLERDYNFFTLAPTYMSQGNGNFRDVNQNRRNDVWFNQDVGDSSIVNFLNLVQADGNNSLVVKGLSFKVKPEAVDGIVQEFSSGDDAQALKAFLKKSFMPGDLLKAITRKIKIKGKPEQFLGKVLSVSQKHEQADFGEGYWTDHWTYNLDLIESYLRIFPEALRHLLLDKKDFTFYLNDAYVLPRDKRYVLTPVGVRQYHSVAEGDTGVNAKDKGNRLRVHGGTGDVYHTNLLVKLLCLVANRAATLDPSGIGIEMEANKPNWYDALNGLPGLLGSSINETFEVKRLAAFVHDSLNALNVEDASTTPIFAELADFIDGLSHLLTESNSQEYWKKSNDLKEHYRQTVRMGIDGKERSMSIGDIKKFLGRVIERVNAGIARAKNSQGLFASYYYHEVTKHDVLDKSHHGEHHVRPLEFKRHDLPYFLEGLMHGLRVEPAFDAARLYAGVKKSPLYDKALGMYKVNARLANETEEIGRTRIFPSGWLENESIWLHMEYKYLLEVLRRGLYTQFFDDMKACFIPFQDPARYGRSILENSSFIVSSAHEDKALHGQGFVARLSGSTAELIHIWLIMNAGHTPFALNADGVLTLKLKPILPAWLFTAKAEDGFPAHVYAFNFLSKTLVVYHNPKRGDTFGAKAVQPVEISLTYPGRTQPAVIKGGVIEGEMAKDVRAGKVSRIDVVLG